MKTLITGGHLTPALAYIDYVQKHQKKDRFVFVGRQYSQDILQQEAVEAYEVKKRKIPFLPFQAERLGGFPLRTVKSLPRFWASLQQAKKILKKEKPDLVLSFGGYLAVPFALAAFQLKIPVVTHEQTLSLGRANRFIARFSAKVAISFMETLSEVPTGKAVLTGNPLRPGILKKQTRPQWFPQRPAQPILLIMGGNQGAEAINRFVRDHMEELTQDWVVVHQCGKPTTRMNTREVLERTRDHLPENLRKNYFVLDWIDAKDLFWLYNAALGAISRSGANTTQELAVAGLPSILIPLPQAYRDEQKKNAQWLVEQGGAILLDQAKLKKAEVFLALEKLVALNDQLRLALEKKSFSNNAAEKLYKVAQETAQKS